jgi:hypothetical protein
MNELLQIALNSEKQIVSIYQVPTGIKCNCTCPECGEQLAAKNKGKNENTILAYNQKQAHFAHVSGKVCKYATESALHKMAKEILFQYKTLMLPSIYHYREKVSDDIAVTFDEVELEKRIDHKGIVIIPDAVLVKGKKKLFIEFYRSHLVDDNKKEKLEHIGVSTLEVDLNYVDPIIEGKPNYEGLKHYLETDSDLREWLINTEGERLYRKREAEDKVKPKYSLDFLKKQEEIYEEENTRVNRSSEDQAAVRKSVEKWKDKAIANGYELVKVYGYSYYTDKTVYCPKEKRNENKKEAFGCNACPHFLNFYYPRDESYVLCGFKANLIKKDPFV